MPTTPLKAVLALGADGLAEASLQPVFVNKPFPRLSSRPHPPQQAPAEATPKARLATREDSPLLACRSGQSTCLPFLPVSLSGTLIVQPDDRGTSGPDKPAWFSAEEQGLRFLALW